LPFPDHGIDAAFACGILHHARNPQKIVREMLRVSRKAVFLSDENRFAHGSTFACWAKLALCKLGLFHAAYRIKTFGKGYRFSQGDGIAYSYSVYDSIDELSRWADRVILIPTDVTGSSASLVSRRRGSSFHPLLTSFHLLLCAVRDPQPDEAPCTSSPAAAHPCPLSANSLAKSPAPRTIAAARSPPCATPTRNGSSIALARTIPYAFFTNSKSIRSLLLTGSIAGAPLSKAR